MTEQSGIRIDRPIAVAMGRSFFFYVGAGVSVGFSDGCPAAAQERIKVIVDQDARGPGTSDQQAILVFLQSEKFDVLGITTVSGDQWVKEETQHVLRMLEIADRTDIPVIAGAEFPLLNSKEESERWEALYGKFEYKGAWTERFEAQRSTIREEPYHAPGRRASHAGRGAAHQSAARYSSGIHRKDGPQVSRPGGSLGGRTVDQLRSGAETRS
jgi:hypothetical protein